MDKNEIFIENPNLDLFFQTADGLAFYTEHDAINYAKKLDDNRVTCVVNENSITVVAPIDVTEDLKQTEGLDSEAQADFEKSYDSENQSEDLKQTEGLDDEAQAGFEKSYDSENQSEDQKQTEGLDGEAQLDLGQNFEQKLKELENTELVKENYRILRGLVKYFQIETTDQRADTLIAALTAYKQKIQS